VHPTSRLSSSRTSPIRPVAVEIGATELWSKGITGRGIRVAILDTGLHIHQQRKFRNLRQTIDFTQPRSSTAHDIDIASHGTFVTGVCDCKRRSGEHD